MSDLTQQLGEQTLHKVKLEKTLQKMAVLVEETKAKNKLNDGVIQRLDKANQQMSQFLSRLGLENQRLKKQCGIEE